MQSIVARDTQFLPSFLLFFVPSNDLSL